MTKLIAAILAAASIAILATTPAEARHRHHRSSSDSSESLAKLIRQQNEELIKVRRESAEIRKELVSLVRQLRPDTVLSAVDVPIPPVRRNLALAPIELPPDIGPKLPKAFYVFPATATQRGQFRDCRRCKSRGGHYHAGIDLGGVWGSEIVASFAGVVLPAPGRDRGYGPNVIVIKGDDDIVYRYAHLATVVVKIGQRVSAGQKVGTMGKVGRRGFPHLHYEMMRYAEYRRRPYGVHGIDPNEYLGGGRGKRMAAGEPMTGTSATRYAAAR